MNDKNTFKEDRKKLKRNTNQFGQIEKKIYEANW